MIVIDEKYYLDADSHNIILCERRPTEKRPDKVYRTFYGSVKQALKAYVLTTDKSVPDGLEAFMARFDEVSASIDVFFRTHEPIWPKKFAEIDSHE